jgi:hypothetical protein
MEGRRITNSTGSVGAANSVVPLASGYAPSPWRKIALKDPEAALTGTSESSSADLAFHAPNQNINRRFQCSTRVRVTPGQRHNRISCTHRLEVDVESAIQCRRIVPRKPWSDTTTQFPVPTRLRQPKNPRRRPTRVLLPRCDGVPSPDHATDDGPRPERLLQ